jgi:hypothetical protein
MERAGDSQPNQHDDKLVSLMKRLSKVLVLLPVLAAALLASATAEAFCGFYVSGAGSTLLNNATQVVLMRSGNRTVQTMQNNYQGPPEGFAMVIPVPVVLMEDNVKVVNDEVFAKIDQLTAPRLVEYWEIDPCQEWGWDEDFAGGGDPSLGNNGAPTSDNNGGVTVEAEFKVGEYEIVILSAQDGAGLETWLEGNGYAIPSGAGPYLDPYVQSGSYFFVAKVDPTKVTFREGKAVLSPLRFWYESEEFNLPIRLGMINGEEVQDLVVYTLGMQQRYEVANYPNVTIPTNIEVRDEVRNRFGSFYNALFEETLRQNPGAVVTEYAWDASTCDPCPGPTLDGNDYATLGADVLGLNDAWGWTVTRLHARYAPGAVADDLVFRQAPAIVGGREFVINEETGELERGSRPAEFGSDNFQGRYAIRHRWEGEIACENPVRNRWGGPPDNPYADPFSGASTSPNASGGEVDRGEGVVLNALIAEPVAELGLTPGEGGGGGTTLPTGGNGNGKDDTTSGGCATAPGEVGLPVGLLLLAAGLGWVVLRR